jgi:hypothetical protein
MSALCRFCCRSLLQVFLVSDSVTVLRFATGAGHDGRLNRDQEQFFYSFRLDEAVPDDHPVREIAAVLDLNWVHSELAPYYPKLRSTLDRSVFAIRSEWALCREVAHCGPAKTPSDPGSCLQSTTRKTTDRQDLLAVLMIRMLIIGYGSVTATFSAACLSVWWARASGLAWSAVRASR